MTYEQKYKELYASYRKSLNELNEASKMISEINRFEDQADLDKYYAAARKTHIVEREFQRLLHYVKSPGLNPAAEFIDAAYMHDVVKQTEINRGTAWEEQGVRPSGNHMSVTSLTNDGVVNPLSQGREYLFPVVSLEHGIECLNYISNLLMDGASIQNEAKDGRFKHIDTTNPIFVKVVITTY